ncbi:MAG: carboxypeptidase-like regulatory domain-containing protein [Planctomycetota bacterium]
MQRRSLVLLAPLALGAAAWFALRADGDEACGAPSVVRGETHAPGWTDPALEAALEQLGSGDSASGPRLSPSVDRVGSRVAAPDEGPFPRPLTVRLVPPEGTDDASLKHLRTTSLEVRKWERAVPTSGRTIVHETLVGWTDELTYAWTEDAARATVEVRGEPELRWPGATSRLTFAAGDVLPPTHVERIRTVDGPLGREAHVELEHPVAVLLHVKCSSSVTASSLTVEVPGDPGSFRIELERPPQLPRRLFDDLYGLTDDRSDAALEHLTERASTRTVRLIGRASDAPESILVRAAGHRSLAVPLPAPKSPGRVVHLGVVELDALPPLEGRVTDERGRPLERFTVRAAHVFPFTLGPEGTTRTDSGGRFALRVDEGRSITLFGSGTVGGVAHCFGPVELGASRADVDLVARPAPVLVLELEGGEEHPAESLGVTLAHAYPDRPATLSGSRTRSLRCKDGRAVVRGLYPGIWKVVLRSEHRGAAEVTVALDRDRVVQPAYFER